MESAINYIGFFITLLTLILALRINSKVKNNGDFQQFMSVRDEIIKDFDALYSQILNTPDGESVSAMVGQIGLVVKLVARFSIWTVADKRILDLFCLLTDDLLSDESSINISEYKSKFADVIALIKTQTAPKKR